MSSRRPAEVFPPGEFIADELASRGWTLDGLAARGRICRADLDAVIDGRGAITADLAAGLGEAFGTDPRYWLNLGRPDPWSATIGRDERP